MTKDVCYNHYFYTLYTSNLKLKLSMDHIFLKKKFKGLNFCVFFFTYTPKTEDKMKAKMHKKSICLNNLTYYKTIFLF